MPDGAGYCSSCGAKTTISYTTPKNSINTVYKAPKKKRKWWVWLVAFVFFAGCVRAINNSPKTETTAAKTTSKPTATEKPTATPTPTPIPILPLGDTYSCNGLDFTINRAVFSRYAGNLNNLNPTDADYVYLAVYVDATNTTSEKIELTSQFLLSYMSDYSFTIVYDGEVEYNQSYAEYTDFLFANQEILPLATLTNKVLNYKVPVVVQNSTAPIILRLTYKSNACAEWIIR